MSYYYIIFKNIVNIYRDFIEESITKTPKNQL